ncbi:MAG: hypothetical protein R2746_03735 [Acidimicrobiales bacterium]
MAFNPDYLLSGKSTSPRATRSPSTRWTPRKPAVIRSAGAREFLTLMPVRAS